MCAGAPAKIQGSGYRGESHGSEKVRVWSYALPGEELRGARGNQLASVDATGLQSDLIESDINGKRSLVNSVTYTACTLIHNGILDSVMTLGSKVSK